MFACSIIFENKKIANSENQTQCTSPSAEAPSISTNATKLIDFHLRKGISLMRFIILEINAQAMSPYDMSLTKLLKHIKTPSMMYINS